MAAKRPLKTPRALSGLKPAPYNPREIPDEAFAGLGESLKSFGDISGIVFNRRSGNLVSGHQRVKVLVEKYGNLKIKAGRIETPDGSFPVRYVDWDVKTERAANIAANSPLLAGDFTAAAGPLLEGLRNNLSELFENLRFPELLTMLPLDPKDVVFPEFNESAADDVKFIKCPKCGHEWPK